MINKIFLSILLYLIMSSNLKADPVSVSCIKSSNVIKVTIVNKSDKVIYLSNPEKCGVNVSFKADSSRGYLSPFAHAIDRPWKHLVILTPKEENNIPSEWSWSFNIQSEDIKGSLIKLDIELWIASEEDFKNKTIRSLKLVKFSVAVENATGRNGVSYGDDFK